MNLDPALVEYCEQLLAKPMPEAVWDHIVEDVCRAGDHPAWYWLDGPVCLHGCNQRRAA